MAGAAQLRRDAERLGCLWADARSRGMLDLAIAYGWSAMRTWNEALEAQRREIDDLLRARIT